MSSAGLVGVGASAAHASTTGGDAACTAAGGTPTDLAQGWVTQCVFTTANGSSFQWTPPASTPQVTFDLYGAQGAASGAGAPGLGGEAQTTMGGVTGPLQINLGGQNGSSGPNSAYGGGGVEPYAGGSSNIFTNGGGATVVYPVISGPTLPLIVAGGGGGSGMAGVLITP